MANVPLSLAIDQFIADAELAHQFVKGDDTLDVQGAEGTYPSLAKLAKTAQATITNVIKNQFGGMTVMKFDFTDALILDIEHATGAVDYEYTIKDATGQQIFAPSEPVDSNKFSIHFAVMESGSIIVKLYPD